MPRGRGRPVLTLPPVAPRYDEKPNEGEVCPPILDRVRVGVLGAAQAFLGDEAVDLGTRKQRALVAALAMSNGRPVSVDALIDMLWPGGAPPGVNGTLQAY